MIAKYLNSKWKKFFLVTFGGKENIYCFALLCKITALIYGCIQVVSVYKLSLSGS